MNFRAKNTLAAKIRLAPLAGLIAATCLCPGDTRKTGEADSAAVAATFSATSLRPDTTPPRDTVGVRWVKTGWSYNCMECHRLLTAR